MNWTNRDMERMYEAILIQKDCENILTSDKFNCDSYYSRHKAEDYQNKLGFDNLAECRRFIDDFFGNKFTDELKNCVFVSVNRDSKLEPKSEAGVPRFFYNF